MIRKIFRKTKLFSIAALAVFVIFMIAAIGSLIVQIGSLIIEIFT